MSRASTLYASAYDTERMHEVRIRKGGQRAITVDMNGAMPAGVSIASVEWDTSCQSVARLIDLLPAPGVLDARSFGATVIGVCEGNGEIEARATLSDGSVSVQRIAVWVQ